MNYFRLLDTNFSNEMQALDPVILFSWFFLTLVETSTLNPFMFAADFFLKHTFSYVAVM